MCENSFARLHEVEEVKKGKILRSVHDVHYHKAYNIKLYQESKLRWNNKELKGSVFSDSSDNCHEIRGLFDFAMDCFLQAHMPLSFSHMS
ncbi:unnamed protein product [Caretta caretta]